MYLPRYKTTRVIYIYIGGKKNDFTNVANNKAGLSLLFGTNKWKKIIIIIIIIVVVIIIFFIWHLKMSSI